MFATENDNRELFTKAKVPLFITSVWLTQQLGKFHQVCYSALLAT